MDVPSPTEARERSALLTERFPSDHEDDTQGENNAKLALQLKFAAQLVSSLTCRVFDDVGGSAGMEAVPAHMEELATRAVVLKAEQIDASWTGQTSAQRVSQLGQGNLASISAGPWSESYFGPGEAASLARLDPVPAIHELLWALATEDCRNAWLLLWSGETAPAGAVESFEYGQRPGGYPSTPPHGPV